MGSHSHVGMCPGCRDGVCAARVLLQCWHQRIWVSSCMLAESAVYTRELTQGMHTDPPGSSWSAVYSCGQCMHVITQPPCQPRLAAKEALLYCLLSRTLRLLRLDWVEFCVAAAIAAALAVGLHSSGCHEHHAVHSVSRYIHTKGCTLIVVLSVFFSGSVGSKRCFSLWPGAWVGSWM